MNFDDVMRKFGGYWEGDRAWIKGTDGYFWCIATGTPEQYKITTDGKRYWTEVTEPVPKPAAKPRKGTVLDLGEAPDTDASE